MNVLKKQTRESFMNEFNNAKSIAFVSWLRFARFVAAINR
jgi:hypothetical protein